jgi:small subunit ribosomal protein S9
MASEMIQYVGVGRRKTSTARVYLRSGNGRILVNRRPLEEYFTRPTQVMELRRPLTLTENLDKFDVLITVRGGGTTGQAGAVRLGIARALLQYNVELRGVLKAEGFLTRDARKVERKKYGQRGARRRFQFSKR